MEQPIEHRRGDRRVVEDPAPRTPGPGFGSGPEPDRWTLRGRRPDSRRTTHFDGGPSAVVDTSDGLTLLLTTNLLLAASLEQLRSAGISPERYRSIVAKGVQSLRPAYEPIATQTLLVDAPGVTAASFSQLPFERRRRPMFPVRAGGQLLMCHRSGHAVWAAARRTPVSPERYRNRAGLVGDRRPTAGLRSSRARPRGPKARDSIRDRGSASNDPVCRCACSRHVEPPAAQVTIMSGTSRLRRSRSI